MILSWREKESGEHQRVETKRERRALLTPWLWSLGERNSAQKRLNAVHKRARICVFHGRAEKLREEMETDKNRGLAQAELSDWIKRSAWQPGRLALAHYSCHPLATHLAHKTLAQLVGPGYLLHGSQATCGCKALHLHLPKIFPIWRKKIEGNARGPSITYIHSSPNCKSLIILVRKGRIEISNL